MKPLTLIMLMTLISCNQQNLDTKAEGEKLMQLSREWSRAAVARDTEKTLSYWADDAVVISPGDSEVRGKDALRKMVEGGFKNPGFQISWEPKTANISKSGDLGYLIEETRITVPDSTGKPVTTRYNSVTIWKKQADGSWKDAVDMMSTAKN